LVILERFREAQSSRRTSRSILRSSRIKSVSLRRSSIHSRDRQAVLASGDGLFRSSDHPRCHASGRRASRERQQFCMKNQRALSALCISASLARTAWGSRHFSTAAFPRPDVSDIRLTAAPLPVDELVVDQSPSITVRHVWMTLNGRLTATRPRSSDFGDQHATLTYSLPQVLHPNGGIWTGHFGSKTCMRSLAR